MRTKRVMLSLNTDEEKRLKSEAKLRGLRLSTYAHQALRAALGLPNALKHATPVTR